MTRRMFLLKSEKSRPRRGARGDARRDSCPLLPELLLPRLFEVL